MLSDVFEDKLPVSMKVDTVMLVRESLKIYNFNIPLLQNHVISINSVLSRHVCELTILLLSGTKMI